MKFFTLCLVVFFLFISCSPSSDLESSSPIHEIPFSKKLFEGIPMNVLNPYDRAGQLHSQLYTAYYEMDSLVTNCVTVSERVTLLANQNSNFIFSLGTPYSFTFGDRVSYVMQYGTCCYEELINNSIENENAANSLTSFVHSFISISQEEGEYASLYSFITLYEDEVLVDDTISTADKKIILTTTSILRFASYERKKKPKKNTDPDWDMMIWSIAGSVDGSSSSIEDAVVMSIICGVLENGV